MTKLTQHFTLEEFIHSDTAIRLGINNDPPPEVVSRLKRTAQCMEEVRSFLWNNAIRISSGYRCEALEKHLTYNSYMTQCRQRGVPINDQTWAEYFASKSHPKGEACDFTCGTQGTPKQLVARIMDSGIQFDQLICEFDSWVHISFSNHPRGQVLTIDRFGTRNFT